MSSSEGIREPHRTARRISTRVASVAPSATLAVDAKAKALKAAGEDVIGFGAGEPDFATPNQVVDAAAEACHDPRNHHYSPVAGLAELRAAIAEKTLRDSGYKVEPSQVLVTNGAKHAIYNAFATLVDPGDEVVVPAPYWTTYPEAARLAGGVPVVVPTEESSGFKVSVEQLEQVRTQATRMVILCSPSNPTGAVYTRDEMEAIGTWALANEVWVMADEIYEHLVYGERTQHSLRSLVPEIAERCVVINGVAKTYAMTGWRVGWMIASPDVIEAAANLQSQVTSNVANVSQRAALAALNGDLSAVSEMREAFNRRRVTMHKMLNEIDGISCIEPEGAFYAFPCVKGLLGRQVAGRRPTTTLELAEVILDEAKVAVVPGEAFGAPGYLRLSYALADGEMEEGIRRIGKLVARMAQG
ncbi:MAG: pyridoxal phosphate-dependent aminotransferase [Actinobacteria bacterium]|nr:pyridoxal phosphate-dependent aminotransferase [Actinomycetota bacterium]